MTLYLEVDHELKHDQTLWRYMDLAKFVSLITTESLWLARADTFHDSHEAGFPNNMRSFIEKAYQDLGPQDHTKIKDANDFQDYIVKNSFVSCWHKNAEENMIMWSLYGKDNNSVAIQTSVERLFDSVYPVTVTGHSLILGEVEYKDADEIDEILPYERCIFRKRRHFSFEKEVRLCLNTYSVSNPYIPKDKGVNIRLEAFKQTFIDKVLVHPDSSGWFLNCVNSLVTKYEIHANVERGVFGNS